MKNNSLETIFSPRDAAHEFLVKASDSLFKAGKTSSRGKADYVCVHIRRLVWKWNRSSVQICDETYRHVPMPAMKCQTEGKIRTLTLTLSREDIFRKDHLKFEAMNNMPHLGRTYFIQVKEQPWFFLTKTFENCCLIYFQAMDHLAEQLHHPIFVIVTDDPIWAKGKIPPGFRPVFTGENFSDSFEFLPTNHNYLGFYNESAQDSAGLDLAVLATCNYTILSRFAFKCVHKHV